jgi:hypothetical protein
MARRLDPQRSRQAFVGGMTDLWTNSPSLRFAGPTSTAVAELRGESSETHWTRLGVGVRLVVKPIRVKRVV